MGEKVYNRLSITGFVDEAARQAFRRAAAKGSVAFSLERLLPLPEPDPVEQAVRWGSPIYEEEGDPESVNNGVEAFELGGELGLIYSFDSRNDPPDRALRHLSRRYPELLMKLHSESSVPVFLFALYQNGERFSASFDREELIHTRAAEWPMIAALSPENWGDEALHSLVKGAAEKLRGDDDFDGEMEDLREELRRRIASRPPQGREPPAEGNDEGDENTDVPF